jgi:hypothetical protein
MELTLIDRLDAHHRSSLNEPPSTKFLTNGKLEYLDIDVQEIVRRANIELIGDNGRPNMARIREVSSAGYEVSPGEVDSFGWLSGIIYTRTGLIVFG